MICFESHIDSNVVTFFNENKKTLSNVDNINSLLKKVSGINDFFSSSKETEELLSRLENYNSIVEEPNRREYGDFQTNKDLTNQVTNYISSKSENFEFILEPTCGKGNFILASISQFKTIKKIVGVEIYQPYVWETKFKLLSFFLENSNRTKPNIDIIHANAFEFPYEEIANKTKHLQTLIIGNPPWVTNSELGTIDSTNLPQKSNFKKHKGFDALTGKGNFDIGEYISLIMLKHFGKHNGTFAFLIKNSVIRNITHDQINKQYQISNSEKLNIDSKKEFNVSVNASLFLTTLNQEPDFICKELDFYTHKKITTFGWYKDKFVNSIKDYDETSEIDGKSSFVWRSGIKHDCSKIMEFERVNGHFVNGLKQELKLEKELVFGLLKSSDLKDSETNQFRKLTIVTQKKIGAKTNYIKSDYPLTFDYLNRNKEYFDKRKSSIYKDKPSFSIFGVGDYSFTPFKIGISGMYKTTHFTLIKPEKGKPIMLDDTCYFIGFQDLKMAKIAHYLVNSKVSQKFLKSIIFSDSKRSINKDILMRIDFKTLYDKIGFNSISNDLKGLTESEWTKFGGLIKKTPDLQMKIF